VRDDVEHVEPSLEDAYLLLRDGSPEHETTQEVAS
jgi:ABC-2 type transport system ATP-binding protein